MACNFFHKIRVYKILLKASLKKALLNAFYSSLIAFFGTLLAQLQNTQQVTIITVVTAVLSAAVTFLVEFRENYPFFKFLLEQKKEVLDLYCTVKFMRLLAQADCAKGND